MIPKCNAGDAGLGPAPDPNGKYRRKV